MRLTTLGLALFAGLVIAAGTAIAQDNATEPEDGGQAWVDDCPPDMMCAMSDPGAEEPCKECSEAPKENTRGEDCEFCRGSEGDEPTSSPECGGEVCAYAEPAGNDTEQKGDEPTYSGDCGGEVCAYDEPATSDNCMDGEQDGEVCDDDVRYMNPPANDDGEPAAGDGTEADTTSAPAKDAAARSVPAFGFVAMAGALGAALAFVAPRRRS